MRMIKSIRFGISDIARAKAFWDATLAALGGPLNSAPEGSPRLVYRLEDSPLLILGPAANGEPVTYANGGTMLLEAPSAEAVHAWHAAGLANGGTCARQPEPKPQTGGKIGAYLRDPDGNKIGAYFDLPL